MGKLKNLIPLLLTPVLTFAFDPEHYNKTRALRWGLVKDREDSTYLKPTAWRGKPVPGANVELRKASNTNNYNIYMNGQYIGWREDKKIGEHLGEIRIVRMDNWSYYWDPYSNIQPYYHAKVKLYTAGEELARQNPQELINRLKEIEPSLDYEVRYRNYRNPHTGKIITKPYIKVIKPKTSQLPLH